jgi:hypothetical protein
MATQHQSEIKRGQIGFGVVGNYPPANWRFDGTRNGSCVLTHVKHPSQSVGYPPQFVSWDEVRRLLAS